LKLRGVAGERIASQSKLYHRRMEPDLSAFVLAGGKSTRMGTDKAFVVLDGRTLLARMLDVARQVTSEVYVVGDAAKFAPFAPVIEDVFPGCGPLGGIHASLRASRTDLNVIIAVDVPFVSHALINYLVARAKNSPDSIVTVARANGGLQPLCAIYRRGFADIAEKALRVGSYKIDALFNQADTEVIGEEELEVAGFSPRIFRNLNSPRDLDAARGG
jgi:molybdopterin-guanine dinucleotide biosynthesis protein A